MLVLYLKALGATIIIEEVAALFWRERSFRLATLILIVNMLTNPLVNVLHQVAPDFFFETFARYVFLIFSLESGVWALETLAFWRCGEIRPWKRAAFFALSLNATSYFSGVALDWIGYWD